MKNPSQLFWRRLRNYHKMQWQTLRRLTDWTIMLYILVPFLIFLGVNHGGRVCLHGPYTFPSPDFCLF